MTEYRISWVYLGARRHITVHNLKTARLTVDSLESQGAYDVNLMATRKTFNEVVITFDEQGPRKL